MEIKTSLQGILVYGTMGWYLLALVLYLLKREKFGDTLFAAGFMTAVVAFLYRWYDVAHWPMQNLFEIFLSLGVLIYPISMFSKRVLGVSGGAADVFLGIIILVPAGFFFSAEPQRLPPALQSWLFVPHVAVYMLSYVFMGKGTFQAIFQLASRSDRARSLHYEQGTYYMVLAGFPLLTMGLLLGSWWGKLAWGDYWGWDPKELWSLVSWLAYLGYLHFRLMFGRKHAQVNSALAIIGMTAIIITLLWVNLSKLFLGLHNYAS